MPRELFNTHVTIRPLKRVIAATTLPVLLVALGACRASTAIPNTMNARSPTDDYVVAYVALCSALGDATGAT